MGSEEHQQTNIEIRHVIYPLIDLSKNCTRTNGTI
jgi:hypothetical protein